VKLMPLLLAAALLPAAAAAHAATHDAGGDLSLDHVQCCKDPARWGSRHGTRAADIAIPTRDGAATLLLDDDLVAVQLSDKAYGKMRREMHDDRDDDANVLSRAIKAAVYSSVSSLLSGSIEYPVRELRDVRYEKDRLVFVTRDGGRTFDHIDINGHEVTENVREADARAFVREFHRAQARLR